MNPAAARLSHEDLCKLIRGMCDRVVWLERELNLYSRERKVKGKRRHDGHRKFQKTMREVLEIRGRIVELGGALIVFAQGRVGHKFIRAFFDGLQQEYGQLRTFSQPMTFKKLAERAGMPYQKS